MTTRVQPRILYFPVNKFKRSISMILRFFIIQIIVLFHNNEFVVSAAELYGFGMIERMQAILTFNALDK